MRVEGPNFDLRGTSRIRTPPRKEASCEVAEASGVVALASPRRNVGYPQGPYRRVLDDPPGPVWITPPRVAVHTIRVGNMLDPEGGEYADP